MATPRFHKYTETPRLSPQKMAERAADFLALMKGRRSIRQFSDRPIPREVIEDCLRVANSAPSGANQQPWHFVVVSDPAIKSEIRVAAEKEEEDFYVRRAPDEWLEALSLLGTDQHKPFLEIAPYLVVIFAQTRGETPDGEKHKHYYVAESVGIATGMLISALHNAGLACLTHTPAPMRFLNQILDRPRHEKPYLILVVGHPAEDAVVPEIEKRPLAGSSTFLE